MNNAFRAMRDLQSGITYVNAGTTGAEVHLPFGGTKDTGNGHREAGQAALDVFTEWKSIYVDYSGRLQRAQIDNVEHDAEHRALNYKLVWFVPREALEATRERRLRGRRRTDRCVRAVLVVRGRNGDVPRRRGGDPALGEAGREQRVSELPCRDGRPGGAARRRRRRARRRRIPTRSLPTTSTRSPVEAKLWTDGGARGNPGPAAYGYVLEAEDGTVLAAHGETIGIATNNVAEYSALIAGLEKGLELGVTDLEVVSDSELMVKQMRGEYKVKNEALRELSRSALDGWPASWRRLVTEPSGVSTTSSPTGS